jgi:hypothetical protein
VAKVHRPEPDAAAVTTASDLLPGEYRRNQGL